MERWKKIRHHIPNNVWFCQSCILYFYDWFSGWKSPTRTTVEVPDSISHSDCGFLLITTFWFSDEPFAHGKYAAIRGLIYYCFCSYAKQEECLRNVLCENWYIIDRSIWGQAAIGLRSCWCPTLFCSRKFAFLPAAWVKTLCCLDNIIKVYKNVMVLFNVNNILFQYVLSQESSKPLRQTLEAHSLKLVNSTFSIPQVR